MRILLGILLSTILAAFVFGPAAVERAIQGVSGEPLGISEEGLRHHWKLTVVDWHADSLLWKRDLLTRSTRGHVDLPRLLEGNVAVQMFTAVTKSPVGQNYEENSGRFDLNSVQAVMQAWPPATWTSLLQRALHQSAKLHSFSEASNGELRVLRTADDLDALLAAREAGGAAVGGLLGIEGAHALEGELENVDRLFDAGFRMVGLQHFFDNRLGGSLHGVSKGGLTDFGREVVRRLEAREMIIDLAHSSPAVVDEVLALATRPVVVSHTGLHGHCPSARNISDAQMRAIAARGGLIAVGYWDGAVCDISPEGVINALHYAVKLVGPEHVALGSDYDGGTTTSFDTSQLAVLTDTMLKSGFPKETIAAVMGGNSIRFLRRHLPRAARLADEPEDARH